MKRHLILGMVVCSLLVLAIPAGALTLTDVTSVDAFITSGNIGTGANPAAEEAWAEGKLGGGIDLSYLFKLEGTDQNWVQLSDYDSIFAQAVNSPYPLYFIFKTGANGTNDLDGIGGADTDFLYRNIDSLAYLVVDLEAIGFDERNWQVDVFSHVTGFNGTSVPEAGALLMFGSGLIGLVGYRRLRRMQ